VAPPKEEKQQFFLFLFLQNFAGPAGCQKIIHDKVPVHLRRSARLLSLFIYACKVPAW
jgi:hypothetical protein